MQGASPSRSSIHETDERRFGSLFDNCTSTEHGLFTTTLVLLGIGWLLWLRRREARLPRHFDAHFLCHTEDGWTLDLYRYKGPPEGPLLVLCADIGESPAIWEDGERGGWARWLQTQGFDVWVLSGRGSGTSQPHYLDQKHGWGWRIETQLQWDLPSQLNEITKHTKQRQIHWIGRGLGAVLPFLLLDPKHHPKEQDAWQAFALQSVACLEGGVVSKGAHAARWLALLVRSWPMSMLPLRLLAAAWFPLEQSWLWCRQRLAALLRPRDMDSEGSLLQQAAPRMSCLALWQSVSTPQMQQWWHILRQQSWHTGSPNVEPNPLESQLARATRSTIPTFCLGFESPELPLPQEAETMQTITWAPTPYGDPHVEALSQASHLYTWLHPEEAKVLSGLLIQWLRQHAK